MYPDLSDRTAVCSYLFDMESTVFFGSLAFNQKLLLGSETKVSSKT